MLVFGIVLCVISVIATILLSATDDEYTPLSWSAGMVLLFSVFIIISAATKDDPTEKSLKDNTLKVEVRQEIVNGQEVSTDTIYIFTPKKK